MQGENFRGVPASGAPVVPRPLYRCICQVTSHILLQFSTKLQITYHFLTQISKLATVWRIVISLKSSLKKLKQLSLSYSFNPDEAGTSSGCMEWFHQKCLSNSLPFEEDTWLCDKCLNK